MCVLCRGLDVAEDATYLPPPLAVLAQSAVTLVTRRRCEKPQDKKYTIGSKTKITKTTSISTKMLVACILDVQFIAT